MIDRLLLHCAALLTASMLLTWLAAVPADAGTEPTRTSATLADETPADEAQPDETEDTEETDTAELPVEDEADYITLFLLGEQDVNQDQEQALDPRRWENDWEIALEYRYTHTKPSGGVGEHSRDAALDLAYALSGPHAWEFGLGLATRSEDKPITTWIALDEFTSGTIPLAANYWLKKDWQCAHDSQLRVQLGRFTYPFDISQITIDNDLLLRGAYVQYTLPCAPCGGPDRTRLSILGAQLLDGQIESTDPARLASYRLDARWEPDETKRTDVALYFHDFIHADTIGEAVAKGSWRVGGPAGRGETTNFTLDEFGGYASDFDILGIWLNTSWQRQTAWPLSIEGEYTHNQGAAGTGSGASDAYYAAIDVGESDQPGAWQFGVDYANVEADAALAAVNRGEYATDYAGTRLSTSYCPSSGVECKLAYTWSDSLGATDSSLHFDDEELNFYVSLNW